jgi:hypothetical protein
VSRSNRRWLLPDSVRGFIMVVDTGCLGSGALAWLDHRAGIELLAGLGVVVAVTTLLALIPARRRPATARTVAAVIAASQPPAGRVLGRCAMVLRLNDADGTPRQFMHLEPRTPTATWPGEGSRVVVEVTRARTPRLAVIWQLGVTHPEPPDGSVDERGVLLVPGLDEAELQALPRLQRVDPVPSWEPSDLASRYLVPTEKFRGEWRRHWIRWVKEAAVGMALALLVRSGYRAELGGYVVDLGDIRYADLVGQGVWWFWIGWRGLTWLGTRLVLTSKRIMLIKGRLWRRVASVPLAKAADTLHTTSPLGMLLRYGAFRFTNVPILRPLWRVSDLPHPRHLYLQIMGETIVPEQSEQPPQLEDSLDDLLAAQAIA